MGAFLKFIVIAVRRIASKVAQSFVTKVANKAAKYSSFSKGKKLTLVSGPKKRISAGFRISTPRIRNKKFTQISKSLKTKIEDMTDIKFPEPKSVDRRKLNDIEFSLNLGGKKKTWSYRKKTNPEVKKINDYTDKLKKKFPGVEETSKWKKTISKISKKYTPAKIKKLQRFVKNISESKKLTKEFNDNFGKNSQTEAGVVIGLNSSWMEWAIYEPIEYKKGWGNLTLKIKSTNSKTGDKIKSSKNPSLIYNFGIGQTRPPIAYWMWEAIIESASAGTTFWDTYFYEAKAVGTKVDGKVYTRKQWYQANK